MHSLFRAFGLDVIKFDKAPMPADFGPEEVAIIRAVQPFTMTSPERIFALIQGIRYLQKRAIAGSIVECGVWKGGSMAASARALLEMNDVSRDLYLFDTFEGMTDPSFEGRGLFRRERFASSDALLGIQMCGCAAGGSKEAAVLHGLSQ